MKHRYTPTFGYNRRSNYNKNIRPLKDNLTKSFDRKELSIHEDYHDKIVEVKERHDNLVQMCLRSFDRNKETLALLNESHLTIDILKNKLNNLLIDRKTLIMLLFLTYAAIAIVLFIIALI